MCFKTHLTMDNVQLYMLHVRGICATVWQLRKSLFSESIHLCKEIAASQLAEILERQKMFVDLPLVTTSFLLLVVRHLLLLAWHLLLVASCYY